MCAESADSLFNFVTVITSQLKMNISLSDCKEKMRVVLRFLHLERE